MLRDWDAERDRMQRYADRFDAAEQVRIVGASTDLTLSIAGRSMKVDATAPTSPAASSSAPRSRTPPRARSRSPSSRPTCLGRDVVGVHLRFEGGKVVDASAERQRGHSCSRRSIPTKARVLGELGIGCNPGITQHTRNTLFDEKIDGTVHLALGNGIHDIGGTNVSAVHWDIVKDLRPGRAHRAGREVVQQDGRWLEA